MNLEHGLSHYNPIDSLGRLHIATGVIRVYRSNYMGYLLWLCIDDKIILYKTTADASAESGKLTDDEP